MELIDRYLGIVRDGLTGASSDDIIAELSENLYARVEDRERELGRPLTSTEVEALLQEFGHPLVVAGRYRADGGTVSFGRVLIGPELFPLYLLVLKIGLGAGLGVSLVIQAILALQNPEIWPGVMPSLVRQGLIQTTVISGIWIAIQTHLTRYPESWIPGKVGAWKVERDKNAPERVSRFESALQLALTAAIFPLLHNLFWPEKVTFGPFQLGPVWHSLYVPFVAITLVYVAQAVVNLARPDWARLRTGVSVFVTAVWMCMLVYALQVGNWAVISDPGSATAEMRRGLEAVNRFLFYYPILGALFGAGIALVIDLVKLIRRPKPAAQTVAA